MALIRPEVLPTMPVLEADVLSELDDYGIRDITETDPIIGLKGFIKEAALFISTHFDFKGVRCEKTQLYAFPREEIDEVYDYEIPERVKVAQMAYLIEVLKPCEETGVSQIGLIKSKRKMGETWDERFYSTNPFMLKLNAILEPLLKTEGLQEFVVETDIL